MKTATQFIKMYETIKPTITAFTTFHQYAYTKFNSYKRNIYIFINIALIQTIAQIKN